MKKETSSTLAHKIIDMITRRMNGGRYCRKNLFNACKKAYDLDFGYWYLWTYRNSEKDFKQVLTSVFLPNWMGWNAAELASVCKYVNNVDWIETTNK